MSGFDSKRQASKELLKQALDALLCCSPDHKAGAALQIKTVADLRAELAHPDPWREAIDAELICCHIGTADSFPDPKDALAALIDWHVAVALDPEVSSDAQALVDRGAAAVSAALRAVVESAAAADEFQNSPEAIQRLAAMARAALKATK